MEEEDVVDGEVVVKVEDVVEEAEEEDLLLPKIKNKEILKPLAHLHLRTIR